MSQKTKQDALEKFAPVGGSGSRFDVKRRLCRNLKGRTLGVVAPLATADTDQEFTADDIHAFGGIGSKRHGAGGDDPHGLATAIAFKAKTLYRAIEIGVMFDHAPHAAELVPWMQGGG